MDPLTLKELEAAVNYLDKSRDDLLAAVGELSETQWSFQPSSACWSVGDNVEHLGIIEEIFLRQIAPSFVEAPFFEAGRERVPDSRIYLVATRRGTKIAAPERVQPSGKLRPQRAVANLLLAREHTKQFLRTTPDLRERYRKHPIAGALDGYQWALIVAAHTERHLRQIEDVLADPNFPKA